MRSGFVSGFGLFHPGLDDLGCNMLKKAKTHAHATMSTIELSPSSPTEGARALREVEDFAFTDMGWGGSDRWTYRLLSEEQVMPEIVRLCHPETHGLIDSLTFQPCGSHDARSQDRHFAQTWTLPGGQWTFTGVLDGHCSHETVEYVAERLPSMVMTSLQSTLRHGPVAPALISRDLSAAIIDLDDTIKSDFLALFGEGIDGISRLSNSEVEEIINDGQNFSTIMRCMRGTTVLITLVDPRQENLWVANLGDCLAVLVSKTIMGSWQALRINEIHNGSNILELERIVNEHPGEPQCVHNGRVLGFLAPTRAVGNIWMKLPTLFSQRVFRRIKAFWPLQISDALMARNLTPPYLSNVPDVYHRYLRKSPAPSVDMALILCSDGLTDLYEGHHGTLSNWANLIGEALSSRTAGRQNLAVRLLRDAIGGGDICKVSRNLTVEMEEPWMDDTTILVHQFS